MSKKLFLAGLVVVIVALATLYVLPSPEPDTSIEEVVQSEVETASIPALNLRLKQGGLRIDQESELQLVWNKDPDKTEVFFSIYPHGQGKAVVSQTMENDGEYSLLAYQILWPGQYDVTLKSGEQEEVITITVISDDGPYQKIAGRYGKRGNVFFYLNDTKLLVNGEPFTVDQATNVQLIGDSWDSIKIGGYYFIRGKWFDPAAYGLAPAKDLQLLSEYAGTLFGYDGVAFWFSEKEPTFRKIGSSDTFRYVPDARNQYFVMDNTVYSLTTYEPVRVPELDAATVAFAGYCVRVEIYPGFYLKDKSVVMTTGGRVVSHDPENFVAYPLASETDDGEIPYASGYAKDSEKVFIGCGDEVEGADARTFEYLDKGYAKDKRYVYHFGSVVQGANPRTFMVPEE